MAGIFDLEMRAAAAPFYSAIDEGKSLEDIKTLLEEERGGNPKIVHSTEGDPDWLSNRRPLAYAAEKCREDVVEYLIDKHGAEIEHKHMNGCTALHAAVIGGENDSVSNPVVTSLLERGANPMAVSIYGVTPLILASSREDRTMTIGALLKKCDDAIHINHKETDDQTALWKSCEYDCSSNTRVLLSKGADYTIASQRTLPSSTLTTPIESQD
jgi:ankyrin repeat protein